MIKDIINKISSSIKNLSTKNMALLALVLLVVIIFIAYIVKRSLDYKKENPIFYKKGKEANKSDIIQSNRFSTPKTGYNVTWSVWMYVNDWNYKYGKLKNVFTRGDSDPCPSVWIGKNVNDLYIYITTVKNGEERLVIKNFPLKTWFQIAIVIETLEISVYINGKLVKTHILKSFPKLNHGNLNVNQLNGFHGELSSISYFPRALSANRIHKNYKKGPSTLNLSQKAIDKLKNLGKMIGLGSYKEPGSDIPVSKESKCKA